MTPLTVSAPTSNSFPALPHGLTLENIQGVALFDMNGLPKAYFVTDAHRTTQWVQMVFQALGLRSLLVSYFKLEGFHHIAICLKGRTAIVVRRRHDYVALLLLNTVAEQFADNYVPLTHWVNELRPNFFEQYPWFTTA